MYHSIYPWKYIENIQLKMRKHKYILCWIRLVESMLIAHRRYCFKFRIGNVTIHSCRCIFKYSFMNNNQLSWIPNVECWKTKAVMLTGFSSSLAWTMNITMIQCSFNKYLMFILRCAYPMHRQTDSEKAFSQVSKGKNVSLTTFIP